MYQVRVLRGGWCSPDLARMRVIGRGAQGTVYQVRCERSMDRKFLGERYVVGALMNYLEYRCPLFGGESGQGF